MRGLNTLSKELIMLSQIQLEELSYNDLKDLVRASGLTIPKHASQDVLVQAMVDFYQGRKEALVEELKNQEAVTPVPVTATPRKAMKYGQFDTKSEYVEYMLTPVLCIITPQSPEFSRQNVSSASISVGNDLIPNREFAFIADGNTVTAVPRIALNRIREMRLLLRGSTQLNKDQMTGNLQGSGFGTRFAVRELDKAEIAEYAAQQKKKAVAAKGVGI